MAEELAAGAVSEVLKAIPDVTRTVIELADRSWECMIINNSNDYTLMLPKTTKKWGVTEGQIKEIHPGESRTIKWVKRRTVFGAAGVLHYEIGETGLVLNVMASVPVLGRSRCNLRICNWRESFENLDKGTGGCQNPTESANVKFYDGCKVNLSDEYHAKFEVTFNYDPGHPTIAKCGGRFSSAETSQIFERYDNMPRDVNSCLCVIKNLSSTKKLTKPEIEATSDFSPEAINLREVPPNDLAMFEWIAKKKNSGIYGVVHYRIEKTMMKLNIMVYVPWKLEKKKALCSVSVSFMKESFTEMRDGKRYIPKPLPVGEWRTADSYCQYAMSNQKKTILMIVYNDSCFADKQTGEATNTTQGDVGEEVVCIDEGYGDDDSGTEGDENDDGENDGDDAQNFSTQ